VTFAATVSGGNPTGSVSFVSGTTTIGSASLVEGTATLMTSLASAGTLSLTANYAGDIGNLPSQSSPVSLTILGPDFSVAASPASATISAGQTATTTLTVTSLVGYTGTVKFSCGTLPSETTCSFSQSSVTPSANSTATTTLTVTTTAASAALRHDADPGQRPWQVISWAGAVLLLLSQRRIKRFNQRLQRSALLLFFLIAGLATLSGCGGSSGGGGSPGNPGTPTGVQTITVTAADSTNGPSHSINFQITVQ
jgi:Bacterial Ig-like domain (group 3)